MSDSNSNSVSKQLKYVYIPWKRSDAGDFSEGEMRTRWNAEDAEPRYHFVWRDDAASKPLSWLGKQADRQLYIMGHGSAASAEIYHSDNQASMLPAVLVASFVRDAGLSPEFEGKIKLYTCASSAGGNLSFACQFGSAMRKLGFVKAHFIGYRASIPGIYVNTEEGRKKFRGATIGGTMISFTASTYGYETARALQEEVSIQ